eukprot:gene8640-10634_t
MFKLILSLLAIVFFVGSTFGQTPQAPTSTPPPGNPGIRPGNFSLGITSLYDNRFSVPQNLYLSAVSGWAPKTKNTPNEALYVGGLKTVFTGLGMRGRGISDYPEWVTLFRVEYTLNGLNWIDYGKNFTGNSEQYNTIYHTFTPPIEAIAIRIVPLAYREWPTFRLEVFSKP